MRKPQQQKLLLAAMGKAVKSTNRKKEKCLFPSCNEYAINSHSQQRSFQLESISENSSVYSLFRSPYLQLKDPEREPMVKTTISNASTFKGFCNHHDTQLFLSIENGNFSPESPKDNFLLFLRAFSFEYATKRKVFRRQLAFQSQAEKFLSIEQQNYLKLNNYGISLFLKKDAPHYLSTLFSALEKNDWSIVNFNSFSVKKNIGVSSTTCFSPLLLEHPQWMKKHPDSIQPLTSLSIIPSKNKTDIAFCWLSEIDHLTPRIQDITPCQEDIVQIINTFVFCESEDVCVNPSLWEKLSPAEKETIYLHMQTSDSLPTSCFVPIVCKW